MSSSNSGLDKAQTLKNYALDHDVRMALYYAYNTFLTYGITGAAVAKHVPQSCGIRFDSLWDLLVSLSKREITGHDALDSVCAFIANNSEHGELVISILNRNLGIRVGETEINKAMPKLIPTYDVALAKKYADCKKKVDFIKDIWLGSRKLDGFRVNIIIDPDKDVYAKTRAGHLITTLDVLLAEVRSLNLGPMVLDGEVCLMDAAGREDFSGIMKVYKKKGYTIPSPKFMAFDCIGYDDFMSGSGTRILSMRQKDLSEILSSSPSLETIEMVKQERVRDEAHLKELTALAIENEWEGIMIRRDVGYKNGRTSDLLKVKEMQDAEYEIVGTESDGIKFIRLIELISNRECEYYDGEYFYRDGNYEAVPESLVDGIMTRQDTETMTTRLIIMHKGNPVGVGSGMSIKQRRQWHADSSLIIGKTATIQYFQETFTDGKYSLRFPILKTIFDGERDV